MNAPKTTIAACRYRGGRPCIPLNRINYHDAHYALVQGFHGPGVRSLVALAIRDIRRQGGNAAARRALLHMRSIQGAIPVWGGPNGTTLAKS